MFLCMINSNYMSNRNRFKDIGTFLSKKLLMPSHTVINALDDLKNSEMFCITGYTLTDPKIYFFCKKLICYQNTKFHQPR